MASKKAPSKEQSKELSEPLSQAHGSQEQFDKVKVHELNNAHKGVFTSFSLHLSKGNEIHFGLNNQRSIGHEHSHVVQQKNKKNKP